jgi:hypothetical protein
MGYRTAHELQTLPITSLAKSREGPMIPSEDLCECEDMRDAETDGGLLSTYLSVPFNEAGKERERNSERYIFPSRRTSEKTGQAPK